MCRPATFHCPCSSALHPSPLCSGPQRLAFMDCIGRVLVLSSDCFPPMGGITIWKSRRTVMSVHPSVKRPFTKFSSHFLGRLYHLFHLTDTMRQSRDSHQHKPQLPPRLEAQKVGKAQEPGHTLWETWARSFHWALEPQGDLSA